VPSPLEVGFETARNAVLDRCTGDWVLMIDSDERLIGGDALSRYLRSNIFHTYSIRQHHLAIDAHWKPDMPGRLFRRGPYRDGGQVMRFRGVLHEHAELGVNQGGGRTLVLSDVHLAHVGYIFQGNRSARFARNLPLLMRDLQKYPERKLTRLVFMRDSVIQAKWLLAQNRLNIDQPGVALQMPAAAEHCRATVRMWEETFADDLSGMAQESMEFYHDACKLLGADVVADVRMSAQRQGVGAPVSPNAKFFASPEHLHRYAAAQAKAVTRPLQNRWF
jgi:hypothetical protein